MVPCAAVDVSTRFCASCYELSIHQNCTQPMICNEEPECVCPPGLVENVHGECVRMEECTCTDCAGNTYEPDTITEVMPCKMRSVNDVHSQ
jgi:hypothetical protein